VGELRSPTSAIKDVTMISRYILTTKQKLEELKMMGRLGTRS